MKVYLAIAKVAAKLAQEGISKARKNVQQGYAFRGIDDVYNALAPFLASEGLCILPNVLERDVVERQTKNGGALFYVTVKVEFSFVCAEDGSSHKVTTYGEAMDSGDKATNKAMSAAYKYAAMQAFCIPTEGDNDADSTTHEVKHERIEDKIHAAGVTPNSGAGEGLTAAQKEKIDRLHSDVVDFFAAEDAQGAYAAVESAGIDNEEKLFLWSKLGSKERSALKKIAKSEREANLSKHEAEQA
jgi:hypothetical protein